VLIKNTFGLSSDKLARVQRLGREFFWIVTGQAEAVIRSLVGVRLLTGILSPDVYGELALGITLAMLVNQIVPEPLGAPVSGFFATAREKGELSSFLTALRNLFAQATHEQGKQIRRLMEAIEDDLRYHVSGFGG